MIFDIVADGHIDAQDLLTHLSEGTFKSTGDFTDSAFHFSIYWKDSQ